jgi:K+-transporting ATPase KdpF subunit
VVRRRVRSPLGDAMDYLLAGVVAMLLFGYLIYALLRPERF